MLEKQISSFFTNKKYDPQLVNNKISFDGKTITQVSSTKFLGVQIDEKLSWSNHIQEVANKISKTCGILAKLKYKMPTSVLLSIYNSLILPYIQYCTIVWGCESLNKLRGIASVQKKSCKNY